MYALLRFIEWRQYLTSFPSFSFILHLPGRKYTSARAYLFFPLPHRVASLAPPPTVQFYPKQLYQTPLSKFFDLPIAPEMLLAHLGARIEERPCPGRTEINNLWDEWVRTTHRIPLICVSHRIPRYLLDIVAVSTFYSRHTVCAQKFHGSPWCSTARTRRRSTTN